MGVFFRAALAPRSFSQLTWQSSFWCEILAAAPFISVVIPNHNGAATIGLCLETVLASTGGVAFEVVVADDGSRDDSRAIIGRYPCRLVELPEQRGASAARNAGAAAAKGEVILFIDADCIVLPDTVTMAAAAAQRSGPEWIVGGTYTLQPYDRGFFGRFQSAFINHFETKRLDAPDYIATHAMVIYAATLRAAGGFPEKFLPIIEDVEFSHRLRRLGYKLRMDPTILVRHLFNYDLRRSLSNAWRKSRYWTIYSLGCRDLLTDSGTASHELKINVITFTLGLLLLLVWLPAALAVVLAGNLLVQRRLLASFHRAGGWSFALAAGAYYALLYPLPVGLGGLTGVLQYYLKGAR